LQINPNFAGAYLNRGVTRSRLGDTQSALADYTAALRIDPNLAGAYLSRGLARAEGGDKPGAMQDFQKAADLFQQQGDKDNYQKAINNLRKLQ
jgi:tetratricopeptide (TPR) repeat protein